MQAAVLVSGICRRACWFLRAFVCAWRSCLHVHRRINASCGMCNLSSMMLCTCYRMIHRHMRHVAQVDSDTLPPFCARRWRLVFDLVPPGVHALVGTTGGQQDGTATYTLVKMLHSAR